MFKNIPEIMAFNECKNLLTVGKNTLLDLLHSGQIDVFKIGNRWKILLLLREYYYTKKIPNQSI